MTSWTIKPPHDNPVGAYNRKRDEWRYFVPHNLTIWATHALSREQPATLAQQNNACLVDRIRTRGQSWTV